MKQKLITSEYKIGAFMKIFESVGEVALCAVCNVISIDTKIYYSDAPNECIRWKILLMLVESVNCTKIYLIQMTVIVWL